MRQPVTGHLYVIAAPSGAGKTSLVKALLLQEPSVQLSTSYTTRKMRPTEVDGRDYHFVSHTAFAAMVAAGAFLEHAQVFDNYYGTARAQVEQLLAQGANVILEIDWQGAQQIRRVLPDCRSVFILPPSRSELERRLRSRNTDEESVIQRRLADASGDMSHWVEFDYVVINADFAQALTQLRSIVLGQGAAFVTSRPGLPAIIATIMSS
ncbi:MAG: guanylate kinase [Steroidobacteraceae bacterium]